MVARGALVTSCAQTHHCLKKVFQSCSPGPMQTCANVAQQVNEPSITLSDWWFRLNLYAALLTLCSSE